MAKPESAADPSIETGAIYDIGYQHYEGERLGRAYAFRSLLVHGVRAVFAVGRGFRALLVPAALTLAVVVPAAIQAAVSAYEPSAPELFSYANYFGNLGIVFALFCAARAPELVSADQRTNTLVLYFARALHREDYAFAKLLALTVGVFLLAITPLLILFAGEVFAAEDLWRAFTGEMGELLPIFGASSVFALVMASLSVAIASFTPRRGIAAAGVLGYFIVAGTVSEMLRQAIDGTWNDWLALLNPTIALDGFTHWLFDAPRASGSPIPQLDLPDWAFGVACLAYLVLGVGVLLARYRRIEA